jgi:predicted PurR-regulated permease PerM
MKESRSNLEQKIGVAILLLLLAGCLLVLLPFVSALLWAVVLSISTWPLYRRLLRMTGGRATLASSLMTLGMLLVVVLPFVVVGASLADNVKDLTAATRKWIEAGPPAPPEWLGKIPLIGAKAVSTWQSLTSDTGKLMEKSQELLQLASAWLLKGGLLLGHGLMQLTLSIFIAFFLFRHGTMAAGRLGDVVGRIYGDKGKHLLTVAGNTIQGVVYGILGTALAQAVLAGIGLVIAGVPGGVLLALLVFFLSVVPGGPPLVMFPAAFWLFHQGSTGWGVFMVIWGIFVSTVDNFIKPWLISKGSDLPFILIFFGVLGGALAFGFIGVFLGPTLLAVGWRLVKEWMSVSPALAADKSTEAID